MLIRMLDGMVDERSLIVGGYFLFNDFKGDCRKFIGLFNKVCFVGWIYVLGYIYYVIISRKYGNGVDVNIGFIIDWLMESYVLVFVVDVFMVVDMKLLVIGIIIV